MKRILFLLLLAVLPVAMPLASVHSIASVQPTEVTVYVTKTGTKYHRSGCQYLSKSRIAMDLSEAKASGYGPCSRCSPPR